MRRRSFAAAAEGWSQGVLSFLEPPRPEPEPIPLPLSAPAAEPPPDPDRPPLRVAVLGSGSGGNALLVESGPHRLLVDAGFPCREIERRLAELGVDPATIGALLLTHEHVDHVRGVNRMVRRHKLPLYATAGTLQGSPLRAPVAAAASVLRSGEPCEVPGFRVEPFALPHDAREPIGFLIEDGCGRRVGLAADLGSRTQLAWARLDRLDVLVLETNHDLDMLRTGPYPWPLKQRIAGRHGHLSNREAAEGLSELVSERLRWVVLYHLSRTNNLPALAAAAVGEALEREACPARMAVADQFQPTPWLEVT